MSIFIHDNASIIEFSKQSFYYIFDIVNVTYPFPFFHKLFHYLKFCFQKMSDSKKGNHFGIVLNPSTFKLAPDILFFPV